MKSLIAAVVTGVALASGALGDATLAKPSGYVDPAVFSVSGLLATAFDSNAKGLGSSECGVFDSFYCTLDDDMLDRRFSSWPPSGMSVIVR